MAPGAGDVLGGGRGDLHGGAEVGVEVAGELISRGVEDPCPARSADGEEEVVDAPEPVEGLADDPAPFAGAGEIGGGAEAFRSGEWLGEPLEGPTNAIGRPAHEEHARPGLEEVTGKDEAEAAGAPSDDHTAPVPGRCAGPVGWGVHEAECSGADCAVVVCSAKSFVQG